MEQTWISKHPFISSHQIKPQVLSYRLLWWLSSCYPVYCSKPSFQILSTTVKFKYLSSQFLTIIWILPTLRKIVRHTYFQSLYIHMQIFPEESNSHTWKGAARLNIHISLDSSIFCPLLSISAWIIIFFFFRNENWRFVKTLKNSIVMKINIIVTRLYFLNYFFLHWICDMPQKIS